MGRFQCLQSFPSPARPIRPRYLEVVTEAGVWIANRTKEAGSNNNHCALFLRIFFTWKAYAYLPLTMIARKRGLTMARAAPSARIKSGWKNTRSLLKTPSVDFLISDTPNIGNWKLDHTPTFDFFIARLSLRCHRREGKRFRKEALPSVRIMLEKRGPLTLVDSVELNMEVVELVANSF